MPRGSDLERACKECGAPSSLAGRPFEMGGTAVVRMDEETCAAGHRYHVVLEAVDEPLKVRIGEVLAALGEAYY